MIGRLKNNLSKFTKMWKKSSCWGGRSMSKPSNDRTEQKRIACSELDKSKTGSVVWVDL